MVEDVEELLKDKSRTLTKDTILEKCKDKDVGSKRLGHLELELPRVTKDLKNCKRSLMQKNLISAKKENMEEKDERENIINFELSMGTKLPLHVLSRSYVVAWHFI